MKLEIFTICDTAQAYNDKLIVVGPFNQIVATSLPCIHNSLSIVVRLRFNHDENGIKKYVLSIKNPQGGDLITPIPAEFTANVDEGGIGVLNLNVNLLTIKLETEGEYVVHLDGEDLHLTQSFIVRIKPLA